MNEVPRVDPSASDGGFPQQRVKWDILRGFPENVVLHKLMFACMEMLHTNLKTNTISLGNHTAETFVVDY